MIVKTGRFGQITVSEEEIIHIPQGILGFPEHTQFCLVDPADETLILWLQSIENPNIAFAVLEPKIFKPDYTVRLSAAELRELKLESMTHASVFSILTLPEDLTQMVANLKAPLVLNLKSQVAKQVVLQENEYSIQFPMFKELKAHLLTIEHNKDRLTDEYQHQRGPISVRQLDASNYVVPLV
ncbi:MAG: flagellar assembly protein FliW [Bdellovibrionaceae bacterium]|nr:flagellar assembly protein FliW [Pseudobdellovibrionaceae bacterium]